LASVEKGLKSDFQEILLIPLENYFVAVSQSHLAFINRDCGRKKFDREREKIQERHMREASILFPILSFIWNEKIDDEEFEFFIRELLLRENGVMRVRKVSAGREPDGGRDLIVEWRTPPLPSQLLKPEQSPYSDRRVVAQCKAYKGGVSKSAVTDIRDTIEHYDAQGYFLAVSSHITRNLTEHLEKLRNGGKHWIDWWTRNEIEDRLRANQDLIGRFPNVIQIRN
jgi:Restriction endonuclease